MSTEKKPDVDRNFMVSEGTLRVIENITDKTKGLSVHKIVTCLDRKLPSNDAVVITVLTDKIATAYVFGKGEPSAPKKVRKAKK